VNGRARDGEDVWNSTMENCSNGSSCHQKSIRM
jgi:hypothetical protein